ncbi:MAG: 50S ribosomal protein L21 [Kordiimonadaceae bacterium]|jgi:large subunit ribosomal protein L21|nr:50S ribosomal protein L21 [Kordiimonadaceae bacterium]MBT6035947.1 50S ribosomal protein L21 [Kordiimonadaceae bacterium]MBT6329007.1 50S ribosomal protein L21 [Kordiimonadaceae bacterium]MBT7583125.1 50S ribosomal protein L21 [Kordiimonadaceae bacterium]
MFAVIKTGAKQYKVAVGDVIKVEKLDGAAGDKVSLDNILMVGDDKGVKVGTPTISGTSVTAEILEQARAAKIIVFKKKRRQNYRRKAGHRQEQTVLRITEIGKAAAKKAAPKKATVKTEEPKAEAKKAAPKKAAEKKAPAKKAAPKKAAAKKPAAKKTATKTKEK